VEKIGFLPNGLMHVETEVSSTNLCANCFYDRKMFPVEATGLFSQNFLRWFFGYEFLSKVAELLESEVTVDVLETRSWSVVPY
jgi:hypothetical protein